MPSEVLGTGCWVSGTRCEVRGRNGTVLRPVLAPCTFCFMVRRLVIILCTLFVACALFAQTNVTPPAANGKTAKTKKSKPGKAIPTEFSEDVARQLLGQIRQGLHGHNPRQMLGVFDKENMNGYYALEDRLYSYFNQYDSFSAFFRILQSSTEKDRGVVLTEWQIEATPASGSPVRREGQVKFEFALGRDGWKVVDFTPRDFFQ